MWKMKWVGIVYLLIQLCISTAFDNIEEKSIRSPEESSCVEVRAVFINCEPEESIASDTESERFEREELFKHSVLRDCNKKLAVTVKITSEPTTSSGDEYLPIEHVFEGTSKKRIRLLDPYILRLRRELPLQAYKLRRVDTISGVLLDTDDEPISGKNFKHSKNRIERDVSPISKEKWTVNHKVHLQTYPTATPLALSVQPLESATLSVTSAPYQARGCVDNYKYANIVNTTLVKRSKRSEHNIVVEEVSDDKQWDSKNRFYHLSEPDRGPMQGIDDDIVERPANIMHEKETPEMFVTETLTNEISKGDERSHLNKLIRSKISNFKENESKSGRNKYSEKHKTSPSSPRTKETKALLTKKRFENKYEDNLESKEKDGESERDYAVYEIGHPELWYTVHVQLFEKLSTPDGKTVWNDLTKGELASVSSTSPEWTGQDLNVRYRPAEWIPRDEFSLPSSSLCLLAPIRLEETSAYNENDTKLNGDSDDEGYIVLPEEDVVGLKDEDGNINRLNDTNSDTEYISRSEEQRERGRRRVVVRTYRALLTGKEEKVNIACQGANKYLTIPHRRPHHAQIDLEARADENELVRVGASGRIAIAVADSSRKTRTVITLQVGNTGLAAARFRVITRDCGPALSDLINEKNKPETMAGPVLIPPRHTRTLRLELPIEIPVDVAQCSAVYYDIVEDICTAYLNSEVFIAVSLVNDEEKSVAVREVSVKKGDRCFCVWHCDCVCLTDDPRLLCREMAEARQSAAGLSNRDRTRHARSACYKDVVTLNIFIIFTGVIVALLLLGCIKAILGLLFSCIGIWGLDQMVQLPRKIDRYYESSLRCRPVEYDCDGYPIHPDTRERSVRMISRSVEFILNVIFFVSVPCIIICDAIKELISRCRNQCTQKPFCPSTSKNDTKKCFSSQDMQGMAALRWRRRRGGLRRWMTPEAQELSKELWKQGLTPIKCEFMRPLLRDGRHIDSATQRDQHNDSCVDSEQDDTDYVLTQMQKSRESLSILKQKSKP